MWKLKLHHVWLVTLLQGELGAEVCLQERVRPLDEAATWLSTVSCSFLRLSSKVDSFSFSKKSSSPFFFGARGFLKRSSHTSAGTFKPDTSTTVDVAMTYDWATRRSGTPLNLYGPVISSRPESSCFRNTTRWPLK